MTNDIEPKQYEIIEYKGKSARLYPNGYIRNEKGMVVGLSADRQRELGQIRKANGEERAREAIMLGTQSESPEEAVMKIIRARTHVAMTDQGRAGNDAAKLVLLASGFLTQERFVDERHLVLSKHEYVVDDQTRELLERIAQRKRDADDGEEIIDPNGDIYKE